MEKRFDFSFYFSSIGPVDHNIFDERFIFTSAPLSDEKPARPQGAWTVHPAGHRYRTSCLVHHLLPGFFALTIFRGPEAPTLKPPVLPPPLVGATGGSPPPAPPPKAKAAALLAGAAPKIKAGAAGPEEWPPKVKGLAAGAAAPWGAGGPPKAPPPGPRAGGAKAPLVAFDPKPPPKLGFDPKPPPLVAFDPKPPPLVAFDPKPPPVVAFDPKPPPVVAFDPKPPPLVAFDPKPPPVVAVDPKPAVNPLCGATKGVGLGVAPNPPPPKLWPKLGRANGGWARWVGTGAGELAPKSTVPSEGDSMVMGESFRNELGELRPESGGNSD
jgi:hypothetical protein